MLTILTIFDIIYLLLLIEGNKITIKMFHNCKVVKKKGTRNYYPWKEPSKKKGRGRTMGSEELLEPAGSPRYGNQTLLNPEVS